jgi:hypothetical protein
MSYMFHGDNVLSITNAPTINNWDVRAVTNFERIFYNQPTKANFTKRLGYYSNIVDYKGTFFPSSVASGTVTVNMDSNIEKIVFNSTTYGTQIIKTDGDFIVLAQNVEYTITAVTTDGHSLTSWSTGANGTLGSTSTNPTTYTVTGDSSLTASTAVQNNQNNLPDNNNNAPLNAPAQRSLTPTNLEKQDATKENTKVQAGDTTYNNPQGVTEGYSTIAETDSTYLIPIIATTAISGIIIVFFAAKRRKDDDEEDDYYD